MIIVFDDMSFLWVSTVQKSDKSFKRKKGSFFIFLFALG
jgi:hypothetical protein